MSVSAIDCRDVGKLLEAVEYAGKRTYWWQRTETIVVGDRLHRQELKARPIVAHLGEESRTFYLVKRTLYEKDEEGHCQEVKLIAVPIRWRRPLCHALKGT